MFTLEAIVFSLTLLAWAGLYVEERVHARRMRRLRKNTVHPFYPTNDPEMWSPAPNHRYY